MAPAASLTFKYEWAPAPGVRAPELRATWARLEIWIGDDCVTLVEDKESQSTRRSIYVSLYPLAEWITYNWWLLQADARPALYVPTSRIHSAHAGSPQSTLARRHNLRAAGDGFSWPDLLIVPEGRSTRLAWRRDRAESASQPIRFLGQGDALVDASVVRDSLTSLVESVLTRLGEQSVTGTQAAREWDELRQTDPEEAEFCLAAARLGLDPYDEGRQFESDILRTAQQLRGDLFEDFLDAVNPQHIRPALDWVGDARSLVRTHAGPANRAVQQVRSEVRHATAKSSGRPWELGWQQANQVRQTLDVHDDDAFELDGIIEQLTQPTDDRGLQAFGGAAEDRAPVVVLGRRQSHELSRFTAARALWHVLYRDQPDFLVTAAHTDRQKIERAFAAELLAPARGIARRLDADPGMIAPEDLEPIAQHFRVSPMVIEHQVANHLVI